MNKIQQIYKILLKTYGRQGWWPIINDNTLMCEYHKNAPKNDSERFEIICGCILAQNTQWYPNVVRAIQQLKLGREFTKQELEVIKESEILKKKISERPKNITKSEILTQNTSWSNVEKAIYNLNKNDLINPNKMLRADKKKICSLIRCAGYYNQKSERLKIVSKFFLENKNPSRQQLLNVKGVGPETADSILLYAFGKNHFVVDTYTKRIFSRMGLIDDLQYDNVKSFFENNLDKKAEIYKQYHALIVEHAKTFCKTKPECEECVLSDICIKKL